MERIGDRVASILNESDDCVYKSVFVDHRIWTFSTKYIRQPTFNYGHRVLFSGGKAASFDLNSNSWSHKVEFPEICAEENMEEELFVVNSTIYLLLYSNFGSINYQNLYKWSGERWESISNFEVDPLCSISASSPDKRVDLVHVVQTDQTKNSHFFVANVDEHFVIHKITVDGDKISMKLLIPITYNTGRQSLERICMSVRYNNKIYAIYGDEGCGFRYNPSKILIINPETKEEELVEIGGDRPSFAFSGPRYTKMLENGCWYHATGDRAVGMTNVKFNGEIWYVELGENNLQWHKSSLLVPDMNTDFVAVTDEEFIIVGDKQNGVFKAKIAK